MASRRVLRAVISEAAVVVAAPGQLSSGLDAEATLLRIETGESFCLDAVGTRVWSFIQAPRRVREIRDLLLKEYEVDAQQCREDLMELLEELAREGLIEIQEGVCP